MDADSIDAVPEKRLNAPWLPAYTALALHKVYLWFVPYWIIFLFFELVKSYLLEQGVATIDWIFMVLWVPAETLSVYFGIRLIKWASAENIWSFLLCQIVALFFQIYFFVLPATCLRLEYILHIITLVIIVITMVSTLVSAWVNNRAYKVNID